MAQGRHLYRQARVSLRQRKRARRPWCWTRRDIELPDLLTGPWQDRTQLTCRTIVSILTGSGRLHDFKRNPQQFIELTAENHQPLQAPGLVDGIKYQKLGDQHVHAQEPFEKEELTGYLKNMPRYPQVDLRARG